MGSAESLFEPMERENGNGSESSASREDANTSEAVVDQWLARLIQRPVQDDKKRVLIDVLADRPDDERNVKKMVQLIVSMPDYQLC